MKAEREELIAAGERKRQNFLRTELEWVRRGAQARSTKQKARLQRFEEVSAIRAPEEKQSVELSSIGSRLGKKTIELRNICKAYDGKTYIKDFSYIILRDDRVGIIGDNGCGKSTLLNIMVTLFVESVICVILGYGGYLVYCGSFDAGQLVEYIGYFSAVVWPIMAVSMLIEKTSRGKASLNRITELLDAKVDVKDRGGVQDLPSIHGKIEFRNLTFRYPDGEYDVLKNVSFTIEPGESVGIVGKTGSGKTTIVDLLLRTYNVPDGTLFIDDHDVNTVSIHSVREGCAYVPQDNFLFSDTISGNISFAFDDENQEAIEDAAMMSDVHDNIAEFKEGYRTVLGERGVTVSGGQKQRISIARALMKHAPILILDDSVSAVDTKTERTILDNLKKREGLTTILIAHRISTVEQMDKIVFVEDGEVHAVGKHEDLYRTCTAYRKMVDLQKLEEEAGEE